ncbi:MAG: hypothetical protein Q9200_004952, partial [Gallowayella weberi]
MKFTIAIAAVAAFLPITLAFPATNDLNAAVPTDTTALADPTPIAPIDPTINTTVASVESAVDLDPSNSYEAAARNDKLAERKLTRNSGLIIKAYRNKNCQGPLVPFENVRYDELKPAKFQS